MPPFLELQDLAKSYGTNRVLAGLSFSLSLGKNLLLIGPSGCGKSTLLRLIAGLERLDEGSIRIDGKLASEGGRIVMAPQERGLAMVFQDLGLWPNLTTFQNVMLGLAGLPLARREKLERARATLQFCEIASKARERPFRLSVGEQQRVALARAMAVRPKLLLLDEPFTGLDLALKNSLFDQICQSSQQFCTTIVLVSHNPDGAHPLSADLAVLEDGQIRETGSFEELRHNPKSRTLRAWTKPEIRG